jgi:hypothetical protein
VAPGARHGLRPNGPATRSWFPPPRRQQGVSSGRCCEGARSWIKQSRAGPGAPTKPAFLFRSRPVNERRLGPGQRFPHSGVRFPPPAGKRTPVERDSASVPISRSLKYPPTDSHLGIPKPSARDRPTNRESTTPADASLAEAGDWFESRRDGQPPSAGSPVRRPGPVRAACFIARNV